jgi:hypothetical protein
MATVFLTLGTKLPIAHFEGPGRKTVVVKAEVNWPAATGQQEPSIPLDIDIEIEQSFGGNFNRTTIPLPNLGLRYFTNADKIDVYAYYSARQALAIPYATYIITGSVIPHQIQKSSSAFVQKVAETNSGSFYPAPFGTYVLIPPYTTEIQVSGNVYGYFGLQEYALVGGSPWAQVYDFEELRTWRVINPLAVQWSSIVLCTAFGVDYSGYTINFR